MGSSKNIYCDESCHLEHDHQPIMVLGAVWCPEERARESSSRIREIKVKHGLSPNLEIKWTKVGSRKVGFYQDVMDYFFDDDDLHFRAIVIDKSLINHAPFEQDHDTWYYKMFFQLLEPLIDPEGTHQIYLDIKDTRSQVKVLKLQDVLCNSKYDFDRKIIRRVQQVHSREVEQIQLADLLIGTVNYAARGSTANAGKVALVGRMRKRSGYSLIRTTLMAEKKVNLLYWHPRKAGV